MNRKNYYRDFYVKMLKKVAASSANLSSVTNVTVFMLRTISENFH